MKAAHLIARVLLGLVFVVAGCLKGMSPYHSVMTVGGFELTPHWLSFAAGITLPGVEVLTGIALLSGVFVRGAGLVAVGLGGIFSAGVVSVMVRRIDIDCGCFGHLPITPRAGWGTLSFDLALVVLGLVVMFSARRARPG